ncbi:MAG TPA: outer membrane beta-barrel protein [Gammaproteobacteria bacterium]|nr:outer membrane beta-barrel protein [Gammaproteobacteria bacterium]
MNKQLFLLTFTAALASSTAYAADTGFYVGGSLGQSKIDISASDIDAELASAGYTSSTSVDDSDTGWKLFAGYRIMKYLSVEGAYTNLGEASASSIITVPGPGVVNATVEGEAWTVSALGILPIGDKFSLFGRLGVNIWNVDVSAAGTYSGATATLSGSDDGTDMVYGVGAAYSFTDNLSMRGEWERYDFGDTDVDLLSAGISWNF